MAYIAKHRRRMMARKRHGGMSGLGGAADCGADQVWCADYVYNGITGQCTTSAQCNQWHTDHPTPQQSTSFIDDIGNIAGALSKIWGAQQPAGAPVVVADTGPSTGEILAIGAAGLLAVYLITR